MPRKTTTTEPEPEVEAPAWVDGEGNVIPVPILVGYILRDLPAIGKTQHNTEQGFMFRGHDDVMNALNPLLSQYGVFIVPDVIERVAERRQTRNGSTMYEVNEHIRFRVYGPAGDYIEGSLWGEGTDMGDKSTNKATTNAYKYFLNILLSISTKEMSETDADRHTPAETVADQSECGKCGAMVEGALSSKEPMRLHYIDAHGYVRQADGTVADPTRATPTQAAQPTATPTEPSAVPPTSTPDPTAPASPDGTGDDESGEGLQDDPDSQPVDEGGDNADDLAWVDDLKGEQLRETARSMGVALSGTVYAIKERIKEAIRAEEAGGDEIEPDGSAEDPVPVPEAGTDEEEPEVEEGGPFQCPAPGCLELPFPTMDLYYAHWNAAHDDDEEPTDEPPADEPTAASADQVTAVKERIVKLAGANARAYGKYRREYGLGKPEELTADQASALLSFLDELAG